MSLRVVGAGVGRTGTHSLKLALELLLGGPCYHMLEVMQNPGHVPLWHAAVKGDNSVWPTLFENYVAAVDWPVASFWQELMEEYPDAVVLLSLRDDAEAWWRSADGTIFRAMRSGFPPEMADWYAMITDLFRTRFTDQLGDRDAAIAAYERHNDEVRASVTPDRLVEWRPRDGWEPLCAALGVPVPDQPFPHVNSTEDFRAMAGWDA